MDTLQRTSESSDRRELIRELYEQGRSVRQIANTLRISTQRVYQQLDKLGLPSPSQRRVAS